MGIAHRLLLRGCLCYQAATLVLIVLVFVYFSQIGVAGMFESFERNTELLITVAVPTTIVGVSVFLICYYAETKDTRRGPRRN